MKTRHEIKIKNCLLLMFIWLPVWLLTACGMSGFFSGASASDNDDAYPYTTAVPGTGGKRMDISVGLDGFVSVDDPIGERLTQRLNINLMPVDVNENDVAFMETLEAAGAVPDVIRVDIRERYFSRWISTGIIRDLPEARTEKFPSLQARMDASDELQAVARLNKERLWFIPVNDVEPYIIADSGRIYYRKDWLTELEELGKLSELSKLNAREPESGEPESSEPEKNEGGQNKGVQNEAGRDEAGQNELNPVLPETPEALLAMLTAFKDEKKAAGITLAGGVTYLLTLFGTDPESWIFENGEWIPAYYSDRMVTGLTFARTLYENGVLDSEYALNKANTAINKLADGTAGALIRHGDAYWMMRVYGAFAEQQRANTASNAADNAVVNAVDNATDNGTDSYEVYAQYLGILPPPGAWPRAVETGGVAIAASVEDDKLNRILAMLSFTLSDEGQELGYFGLRNETAAKGADGTLKLFIDPETAQPVDILQRYPAARLLFILDRSRTRLGEHDTTIPSDLSPTLKAACYAAAEAYNARVVDEGDGFLIRFITTPAKTALEAAVNPGAAFNAIVTGTAPVAEMFAGFQAECREKNIRTAINEVNALMLTYR